jgi:hypothetical protein
MTNNSLPLSKKKDRASYQTFDFINDLLRELQNHPELLAKMFPTRVKKYTNLDLSMIWSHQKDYINSYLYKIRSGKLPNFRFKSKGLTVLKNEVINKLGVKAIGILSIIDLYESSDITTLEFIGKLKRELGRVSGDIEVTLKELSKIFGKSPNFITTLKRSLEDCDINWFKTEYNFSKEILNELRDNLKIDTYSFREALHLSVEFERLNPKIPDYSHQQYTIANVEAFHNIFTIETSYWFGFLCADGYVGGIESRHPHRISFELARKDKASVYQFADFIGFDREKIRERTRLFKDRRGYIKSFKFVAVEFQAKPMSEKLKELGIFGSKSERKSLPPFVKQAIELAKNKPKNKNFHWSETHYGKVAFAWLLGYYDGDGNLKKYSQRVLSSVKNLLEEIKEFFESPNRIITIKEAGEIDFVMNKEIISSGFYSLTLGPEVFRKMLSSYSNSMNRKRELI